jgi:betaine reductase
MSTVVLRAGASLLFHAPGLVRYGSKPARDRETRPDVDRDLTRALRPFKDVVAYAPNQTFVGNLTPWALYARPRPWYGEPVSGASADGRHGQIVTEEELHAWMLLADVANLISPRRDSLDDVRRAAAASRMFDDTERQALDRRRAGDDGATADLPLTSGSDRLFGWIRSDHDRDPSLSADVLLENLACKATGAVALRWMLDQAGIARETVDYVISTSEEAVGDRYQRGGGNLAKAAAELAGCRAATGCDVKNFCAGPLTGIVIAASLVASGVFRTVAVIGGGSLAKLGMKYRSHLAKGMPVLEDVLAATVALVTADDGASPVLRLDTVGASRVRDEASPVRLMDAAVGTTLRRAGLRFSDVDRYIGELHNPEITVPAGGGDVPDKNYRMIAACAIGAGEITRDGLQGFVAARGVPGFAPTQGHVASAACFVPHAVEMLRAHTMERAVLVAKASCFLGRMTQLQDVISFLVEAR